MGSLNNSVVESHLLESIEGLNYCPHRSLRSKTLIQMYWVFQIRDKRYCHCLKAFKGVSWFQMLSVLPGQMLCHFFPVRPLLWGWWELVWLLKEVNLLSIMKGLKLKMETFLFQDKMSPPMRILVIWQVLIFRWSVLREVTSMSHTCFSFFLAAMIQQATWVGTDWITSRRLLLLIKILTRCTPCPTVRIKRTDFSNSPAFCFDL